MPPYKGLNVCAFASCLDTPIVSAVNWCTSTPSAISFMPCLSCAKNTAALNSSCEKSISIILPPLNLEVITLRIGKVFPLGWFWKLGSRLDSLAVAVTHCINFGCSMLSSLTWSLIPLTKVFKYVPIALYLMIKSTNSLSSPLAFIAIFLSVSLSVLNPPSATSDTPKGVWPKPASLFNSEYTRPCPWQASHLDKFL